MTPADAPLIAAGAGAAAALNHLLAQASWARAKLQAHAGRTVRFEIGALSTALTVTSGGEVCPAQTGVAADATFLLTPGLLLRLAARDERAWREVGVAGDAALAETVGLVARNLRWDFEEDLSRLMGDVLAHRVGETVRGLERWRAQTAATWAGALGAYVTEEQPLVAGRAEIERFNGEVDRLRDDVERLAARIEGLRADRAEPGRVSA